MYVEDKTSYNGPIPVVVNPTITVSDLKILVQNEFEFPVGVQVSISSMFYVCVFCTKFLCQKLQR